MKFSLALTLETVVCSYPGMSPFELIFSLEYHHIHPDCPGSARVSCTEKKQRCLTAQQSSPTTTTLYYSTQDLFPVMPGSLAQTKTTSTHGKLSSVEKNILPSKLYVSIGIEIELILINMELPG